MQRSPHTAQPLPFRLARYIDVTASGARRADAPGMSTRNRLLCAAAIGVAAACSSAAAPDASFALAKRSARELGEAAECREASVVERTESEFLALLRRNGAPQPPLVELHFQAKLDPKLADGAQQVDRRFVARGGDPRLYDFWVFEDLIDLARAQEVRLTSLDDVRTFLHAGESLPAIEVEHADKSGRRYRFHVPLSGRAEPVENWRELVLDERRVPSRLE